MPAVTVPDNSVLPRIAVPSEPTTIRPVKSVTDAPSGFEGEGFPVRRAFAGVPLADLDPFIHMDQMGEVEYAPGEPKGTPWHPHRGFETVTYMIDGTFQHQDSIGGGGLITNGSTQWMTAGSGILHIERPPEQLIASGGLFHGIQLWVNLPAADKWLDPRYQGIEADQVLLLTTPDGGALVRVIAGDVGRPPRAGLHPYPHLARARHGGAGRRTRAALAAPSSTRWSTRSPGAGALGTDDRPFHSGQLAVFGPRGRARRCAPTQPRSRGTPRSTCSCWAAGPSGSRCTPTGPSS